MIPIDNAAQNISRNDEYGVQSSETITTRNENRRKGAKHLHQLSLLCESNLQKKEKRRFEKIYNLQMRFVSQEAPQKA